MFHVSQNTILNLHCEQFQNRSNMDVVLVTVTAFMSCILLLFINIILFYVPHIGF